MRKMRNNRLRKHCIHKGKVAPTKAKMRKNCLRWFNHVQQGPHWKVYLYFFVK